jgi:GINS complex subunit 2
MSTRPTFTYEETDFISQDILVEITPHFLRERDQLVTAEYGPFRPNVPVVVPLWVALALKQSGSCTIELDDWFKLENILATQEREKTDAKQLQILPRCYVEQARTVSKYWLEDMPQQSGMASSLEDILSLRKQKLRQSFRKLEQKLEDIDGLGFLSLQPEISNLELTLIRCFSCASMEMSTAMFSNWCERLRRNNHLSSPSAGN